MESERSSQFVDEGQQPTQPWIQEESPAAAAAPAPNRNTDRYEVPDGEDDVVDIRFQVPDWATPGEPTIRRKMGSAVPLPPLIIPVPDDYDEPPSRAGPVPRSPELQDDRHRSHCELAGRPTTPVLRYVHPDPADGLLRRARSYTDVAESDAESLAMQRRPPPQQQQRRLSPGRRPTYSNYDDLCDCGSSRGSYLDADLDDRRRSWALAQTDVAPMRVTRHSYCGAPPSPRELNQRSPRSSVVQSPSYLLSPDRAHSPFRLPDDAAGYSDVGALGRSADSLDECGVSPSTSPLPSSGGPTRKVSTITVTDGPNSVLQIPTDSGQPMVLQLVLPRNASNSESGQGPLSPSTPHEPQTPNQETYDTVSKLDVVPNATNTCTVSTASSMSTLMKKDTHTTYSQLSNTEQAVVPVNGDAKHRSPLPPPTTSDYEKKEVFKKNITTMLSSIYAIFIVMLGGVIYVADILQPLKAYGEVFTIYLTIVGLGWLGFLHFDIRLYLNSLSLWKKEDKKRYFGTDNEAYDKTLDGTSKPETLPSVIDPSKPPPDSYCFKTGRHSGSFYLKIGAAVFCFGHLIHEGLLLSRQIAYFTSEQKYLQQCADVIALILSIVHPLFSFYQLFMVFKYSNLVINRYKEIARFAIMHIIAANLCLWVNTIIRETEEALAHHPHGSSSNETVHYNDTNDDSDDLGVQDTCISRTILSEFTIQAAPYLYPFTIEYSLLQVGMWLIIWCNIGDVEAVQAEKLHMSHSNGDPGRDGDGQAGGESFSSNLVIHVDCHSANRGLFAGLFILLATVVSVIIFFVAMTNEEYIKTGIVINNVSDTVLLLLMIFSVVLAYRQTARLDFNSHSVNALDDFLLYIALPCFFLYTIFNVVGSVAVKNPFIIVISILTVIQVTIQTPFIVDGLRRCSNSYTLRYRKPGREIITFLIVCNVACWILETFEIKSYDAQADRIEYYGSFLWTLLSHITLPLTLFYRFHSSVCLVDMWKSAYEQAETH